MRCVNYFGHFKNVSCVLILDHQKNRFTPGSWLPWQHLQLRVSHAPPSNRPQHRGAYEIHWGCHACSFFDVHNDHLNGSTKGSMQVLEKLMFRYPDSQTHRIFSPYRNFIQSHRNGPLRFIISLRDDQPPAYGDYNTDPSTPAITRDVMNAPV